MGLRAWMLICCLALAGAGEPAKPATSPAPAVGLVRIGDAGSLPDPSRFDERFPEMAEWALAGVQGGVPLVERILGTVTPADDLQAAIDACDVAPGRLGVLVLAPGTYPLAKNLRLKNGLVLRGASRSGSVLSSSLTTGAAISMGEWSALEDLTALNALVKERPESEYIGIYKNGGPSDACTVWFAGGNSWIQRCDILFAGKNPIEIHNGKVGHVTIRDTLVDKAFCKGGQGSGYFDISESHHVLLYNVTIRNIRHLSIMFNATYVVVYGCRIEVDINYHDGIPSKTLVENTVVDRRSGHHWSSVCYGWEPWQDDGPGPRNFIWRTKLDNGEASGEQEVYVLRDTTPKYKNMPVKEPMILPFGPPPAKGTLYAVTGKDIPAEAVEKQRAADRLAVAAKARDWPKAIPLAITVKKLFAQTEAPYVQAVSTLTEAERLAGEALAKLKPKPTAAPLRALLTTFAGTAAADEGRSLAATTAAAEWTRITTTSPKPMAGQVRTFLADWADLAPVAAAQTRFDELANADLAQRKSSLTSPAAVAQFVKAWPGTAAATAAKASFEARLRSVLDGLIARKSSLTGQERQAYIAQFAGTVLEAEARKALE